MSHPPSTHPQPPDLPDPDLWAAFHARTLPAAAWTHRAHLRVAWMFLERHTLDESHVLMRVGIILLNASHGLVETPARGYNDTVTRAYLRIIDDLRRRGAPARDSAAFVDAHLESLRAGTLLRYYTAERCLSTRARAMFVPPDVAALPGED